MPRKLRIVKLGGSVITNKAQPFQIRRRAIASIAKILARHRNYVLVHGAGSFGHIPVRKYGLAKGVRTHRQLLGYSKTKCSLLKLEEELTSILSEEGVPVAPVLASSCLTANRGRILQQRYDAIKSMIRLGLVPSIGGDLVQDSTLGASVISGDQIATSLALSLHADSIIFGTDVDGLYTSDPRIDPRARLLANLDYRSLKYWVRKAGGAAVPDVTGGMRGKLKSVLPAVRAGVRVVILNLNTPERLDKAMAEKPTKATVIG